MVYVKEKDPKLNQDADSYKDGA